MPPSSALGFHQHQGKLKAASALALAAQALRGHVDGAAGQRDGDHGHEFVVAGRRLLCQEQGAAPGGGPPFGGDRLVARVRRRPVSHRLPAKQAAWLASGQGQCLLDSRSLVFQRQYTAKSARSSQLYHGRTDLNLIVNTLLFIGQRLQSQAEHAEVLRTDAPR